MVKSGEPDSRRFWRIFIIAVVFLSVMAVVIINRKIQKEKENPPIEAQPY